MSQEEEERVQTESLRVRVVGGKDLTAFRQAIGVNFQWGFSQAGIAPEDARRELSPLKLPESVLEALSEVVTNTEAFRKAVPYTAAVVAGSRGRRRIDAARLPKDGKNDWACSCALNLTHTVDSAQNDLGQLGIVYFERAAALGPAATVMPQLKFQEGQDVLSMSADDEKTRDELLRRMQELMEAWTGHHDREQFNALTHNVLRHFGGFPFNGGRGNSWVVLNDEHPSLGAPTNTTAPMTEGNNVLRLINYALALSRLWPDAVLQVLPIYPDPTDAPLSNLEHLRRQSAEFLLKETEAEIRKIVTILTNPNRGQKKLRQTSAALHDGNLHTLLERAETYRRILRAQTDHVQDLLVRVQAQWEEFKRDCSVEEASTEQLLLDLEHLTTSRP